MTLHIPVIPHTLCSTEGTSHLVHQKPLAMSLEVTSFSLSLHYLSAKEKSARFLIYNHKATIAQAIISLLI